MDVNKLVKAHLAIRERRKALSKAFDDEDGELKQKQELLENVMLKVMAEQKVDNMKTNAGTMYRQEQIKPAASDWDALYKWIKENDAFDALERRIKSTFVKDFMEENDGDLPPGVSVYRHHVARVRST